MIPERKTELLENGLIEKLNIDYWLKPGIRHQGLSQQDFSVLTISRDFVVTPIDKRVIVTQQRIDVTHTYSLDSNGRIVGYEIRNHLNDDGYPITYSLRYDNLGRLTRYHYSGSGECMPNDSRTENFEYPEGRPDDHYTQISENDFYGRRVSRKPWETRQALNVLKR